MGVAALCSDHYETTNVDGKSGGWTLNVHDLALAGYGFHTGKYRAIFREHMRYTQETYKVKNK